MKEYFCLLNFHFLSYNFRSMIFLCFGYCKLYSIALGDLGQCTRLPDKKSVAKNKLQVSGSDKPGIFRLELELVGLTLNLSTTNCPCAVFLPKDQQHCLKVHDKTWFMKFSLYYNYYYLLEKIYIDNFRTILIGYGLSGKLSNFSDNFLACKLIKYNFLFVIWVEIIYS